MSFLSRLFRKTPSVPASTGPASAPSAADEKSAPKSGAAERARVAAAETIALQSAIEAGDVQAVAGLVVAGASTQVRQAAASAIEDPDVLRRLIRDVRGGNDKHVYKILTTKREVLLERTRERERLQAEIDAAAEAIERHGKRAYDALYVSRLDECERRWAVLATQASPERRDGVQRWIAAVARPSPGTSDRWRPRRHGIRPKQKPLRRRSVCAKSRRRHRPRLRPSRHAWSRNSGVRRPRSSRPSSRRSATSPT
jgi:hypothetical protein